MLKSLQKAFKVKEVRDRLLYTFMMLVVIRIGCCLPIPGVDPSYLHDFFSNLQNSGMGFFNAITGGSFSSMSIFALSITPYITSSIIMQLLTIAIPKLEEMQKDGEDGRKKIAEYTRYLTVGLALFESCAMAVGLGGKGLLLEDHRNIWGYLTVVAAMTAGSALLMWIGERITDNGVGNGISIVLLINIVSGTPQDMITLYERFMAGKSVAVATVACIIVLAIIIAIVVFVLVLNDAERRIPVQYSKKMQGRRMIGGQSTYIPLKVNTANVIPVIFASSLMMAPIQIASFFPSNDFIKEMQKWLGLQTWYSLVIYVLLILFFTFFYTKMQINPEKVAENLGKSGSYIPSVRPGSETKDYINRVLSRITVLGSVALAFIAVMPHVMPLIWPDLPSSMALGGTGMIIVVGVAIETVRQVQALITQKSYKKYYED